METNDADSSEIPEFTGKNAGSELQKVGMTMVQVTDDDDSSEIPEFTDRRADGSKRQKVETKALFKMRIGVLQSLEGDVDADCFKFKEHSLSLVMCGGRITEILRDDDVLFSFEIDDDSGKISCFHKFKYNREDLLKNLEELPTFAHFSPTSSYLSQCSQTSFCPSQTGTAEETVSNVTKDDLVQSHENNTREILTWFKEEIVEKPPSRKIGDFIHVMGFLMYGDGIRKINVLEFRKATEKEHEDLLLEIDYLNRCVY